MATNSWVGPNGNWSVPANWSQGSIPDPTDDVRITVLDSTVNFDVANATINTLIGTVTPGLPVPTLNIAAGKILVVTNGGSTNVATINVGSGATLSVGANTLQLGNGTITGTLSGAGAIVFGAGSFVLGPGAAVLAAKWILGTGTLSTTDLETNIAYANNFTIANLAVLNMHGHALSLSSTTTFGSATINGLAGGHDTLVLSGTNVDLSALTFTNWTAGEDTITLNGTMGLDFLFGSSQSDTLSGGAGADTMRGLAGDDTYVTDGTDTITELIGGGNDLVQSSVSYALGDNLERLTLLAAAGNANATGNTLANVLIGNAGANVLDGGADALADALIGLGGNDTYIINDAADDIVETAGQGTADRVRTALSFALAAGDNIEFLQTRSSASTTSINLTGNEIAQTITGNSGINILTGNGGNDTLWGNAGADTLDGGAGSDVLKGGTGIDRMNGGGGNDTYEIDTSKDVLIDSAGIDTVRSTVTKTLALGFERLTLIGSSNLNGTGNASANILTGNSGKNTLTGSAGNDILVGANGRDILRGGTGADDFDYNAVNETGRTSTTRDRITDFTHGSDDIDLKTIDANGSATGNGTFKFVVKEGAVFTGVRGQLIWDKQDHSGTTKDVTIISGDINGDKQADFQIELTGLKTLTAGDFIL